MNIFDLFNLVGGLALFLYGMQVMADGLEKRAGTRLKVLLEKLTRRPIQAVLLGAAVTAVIQSSSATTVMVVGFVNSGVMALRQAIGVVMGANIGTTVTAWLLSLTGIQSDNFLLTMLKPSSFSPLLAFAGILLFFSSKRRRDIAGIMLGFAVLMFGMEMMSGSVKGLAQDQNFIRLLTLFSNPFLGVLVGAVVTAIVQSSSASVGVLQAVANSGVMTYGVALPIIMGQNIGTCITAIISSIGANRNAKRVAAVHLSFNVIGTVVALVLFYSLDAIIGFQFVHGQVSALGIAVTHTAFNLFTTALLFPFINQLESLAHRLIREDTKGEQITMLDERLLASPAVAVERCRQLTNAMAQQCLLAYQKADSLLENFSPAVFDEVSRLEDLVDQYEDKLGNYLVKVSAQSLREGDSLEVAKLLRTIGDLERISDHAVNLGEAAQEMDMKGRSFSQEASEDTAVMRRAVLDILQMTVQALETDNLELAARIEPLEEVVDILRDTLKERHIRRLQAGSCTLEMGFVLGDTLTNLERVSDHCSNIAVGIAQRHASSRPEGHVIKQALHNSAPGSPFQLAYEEYLQTYALACAVEDSPLITDTEASPSSTGEGPSTPGIVGV